MEIEQLIPIVGRPVSDAEVARVLSQIGVDVQHGVALNEGEYRAYVERPKEGFSLVFTDEAMFLNKANQGIGVGELFFSGLFLYAQGKDGYSQFQGQLPKGISFFQDRSKIIEQLGVPSWERKRDDGSIAAERWDIPPFTLHLTYSREKSTPTLVSFQVPDQKRSKAST